MRRSAVSPRWTPSGHQVADGLTKDDGSAADSLRAVIVHCRYQIHNEQDVLAQRAEPKADRIARGAKKAKDAQIVKLNA